MNTKALRQKVLDLAIHGKLVPQNQNDESATVLLDKIRAEKAEKIKKGELKADKKDSFIFVGSDKRHYEQFADGTVKDIEDEIPFEVPEGWAWCRLGEICSKLVDGDHNPPKGINEKTEYLMISSRNINHNQVEDLENVRYLTKDIFDTENKRTNLQVGDILFTSVGSLGRSCVYAGGLNLCFQRSVTIIHTNQYNFWLKYYFDSDYYQAYILDNATGTAQLGFYLQQMEKSFIPLPPLAEQERIVSVIKSIFSQIDTLDQNKSDLQTAIKQAKSKILDLAIHGKLVSQDPNDEPAEELLKRIATSDNRPYKKFEEAVLFEIPKSWSWCYLHTISALLNGDRGENYPSKKDYVEYGIPFINAGCLDNGNINYDVANYITEEKYNSLRAGKIQKGDILYCLRGSLGKTGFVITDNKGAISSSLCIFRLNESVIPQYFLYVLNSNAIKVQQKMVDNGTAQPNLSAKDVSNYQIPLPPLAEQYRIVTKIEELFEKLDIISN